jgi:hypothetical protein
MRGCATASGSFGLPRPSRRRRRLVGAWGPTNAFLVAQRSRSGIAAPRGSRGVRGGIRLGRHHRCGPRSSRRTASGADPSIPRLAPLARDDDRVRRDERLNADPKISSFGDVDGEEVELPPRSRPGERSSAAPRPSADSAPQNRCGSMPGCKPAVAKSSNATSANSARLRELRVKIRCATIPDCSSAVAPPRPTARCAAPARRSSRAGSRSDSARRATPCAAARPP